MRPFRTLSILIVLLAFVASANAQSKDLGKANKLYKLQKYAEAIPFFEKSLEEKSSVAVQTKLAYCYKVTNQIDEAEKLYSDIVYADRPRAITFFYYGESLMLNGKYAAAKFWFEEYLKKKPGDEKTVQLIESCDKVNLIKPHFGNLEITPATFNSEVDDNAPVYWGEKVVFCSDRKQGVKLLKQKSGWTGRDFINLYRVQQQADGSFSEVEALAAKINGLNKNTGPISFNADGSKAVFTRNSDIANKKDAYAMQLYQADFVDGKWKNVEAIAFCNTEFNYMHPALSPDGKQLFFVSDRPGGSGGTEIYQSVKRADDTWGKPTNMGNVINTVDHEGFPFVDHEGRLFFSSKGHMGFGGFDIFFTQQDEQGNWAKPTNVGYPINSSADDISICLNTDGETGMFTSSRAKAGDDIFFFAPTDIPNESPTDLSETAIETPVVAENTPEPAIIPSNTVADVAEEVVEENTMDAVMSTPEAQLEPEVSLTELMANESIAIDESVSTEPEAFVEETITEETIVEEAVVETVAEPVSTEQSVISFEVIDDPSADHTEEVLDFVAEEPEALAPTEIVVAETPAVEIAEEVVVEEEMPSLEEVMAGSETENVKGISEAEAVIPSVEETAPVEELADMNTTLIETPEAPTTEVSEPARLEVEPVLVDKVLEIEASDLAPVIELAPGNSLSELNLDLTDQQVSADKTYFIPNVDYDFNETEVTPELVVALQELARILIAHPQIQVQLIGHTASFGNNDKNLQLSQERAQAAANYLIQQGVAESRLSASGLGESQLLNECFDGILCSIAQHKENERLELKVIQQ